MSELLALDARSKPRQSESPSSQDEAARERMDPVASFGEVLDIGFDEFIFRTDDPKTHVYRLESGIVFLCAQPHNQPIEIVCPGNYLGLGFLKKHIHSARVVLRSCVRAIPLDKLPQLIACDPDIKNQLDAATEREFNARRAALVSTVPDSALNRVAGFLVAVSRLNAREGRDPRVVDDGLACGAVADWLSMDITTLASQLVELRKRGLINHCERGGLYLANIPGLEAVYLETKRAPSFA